MGQTSNPRPRPQAIDPRPGSDADFDAELAAAMVPLARLWQRRYVDPAWRFHPGADGMSAAQWHDNHGWLTIAEHAFFGVLRNVGE